MLGWLLNLGFAGSGGTSAIVVIATIVVGGSRGARFTDNWYRR